MREAIQIEAVTTADGEVLEALTRLIPQLSPFASVPSAVRVEEIAASPASTLLVARDLEADRRIVGTLTLVLTPIPTGMRALIEDVVVDSMARGKGVGETLCRHALGLAASRGAQMVDLTSQPSKEAANRLYKRLGFELRDTNVYRYTLRNGEQR